MSKYNVYDATPFHRDVLKELSEAAARHHIKFGFYYSQAQDWHEPNGAGNTWDFGPDDKKDFDQYLRGKAEPQVKELLTNYGPICLVWFDTPRMMTSTIAASASSTSSSATRHADRRPSGKKATMSPWATTPSRTPSSKATGKFPRP